MSRHLPSALLVAVLGVALVTVQAADPIRLKIAPKEPGAVKGLDADPDLVQGEAANKQEALRRQFDDFKQSLLRLAQRLEASSKPEDREKAAILKKAIALASEQGVDIKFTTLVAALKASDTFKNLEQLQVVLEKNEDLRKDLRNLIELLLTDDQEAEARRKREEYARLLEKLKEIIAIQERIRDQAGLARKAAKDLEKDQKKVTKQTHDLVARREDKDAKGNGEPKSDAKTGKGIGEAKDDTKDPKGDPRGKEEAKADNKGDKAEGKEGKPSDGKEAKGDGKDGKGDSKDGKDGKGDKKDGKPGSAKESKPGDRKESKPSDGKGDSKENKTADAKSGKPSDAKASDPKTGKPNDGKGGDPKEGKPSDGKGSDSKAKSEGKSDAKGGSDSKSAKGSDSKPSDSKGGQPGAQPGQQSQSKGDQQPGGQPPPPSDQPPPENAQVKKQIQDANQDQKKAGEKLAKNDRNKAVDHQEDAIRKLLEAKKRLEELLRQLREEEIERLLAALQLRCERMLANQIAVRDGTVALDKVILGNSDKKPTRGDEQQSNVLSDKEDEIVREASKAFELVKAEGSAVAFAEIFYQVRGDMTTVAGRLRKTDVGVVTVTIENDIIATLEEMIEALKKARQENQKPKPPMPSQAGGPPPDQKLIDMLAELKMIRSMQKRVNDRTLVYGKQYEGEQAPAQNEMIQRELRDLGNRQAKIGRITNDIYKGKNKAN